MLPFKRDKEKRKTGIKSEEGLDGRGLAPHKWEKCWGGANLKLLGFFKSRWGRR